MANEHQGRVKGTGKYGVVVKWQDDVVDTDWFEDQPTRNNFYRVAKNFKTAKSVRKVDR